MNNQEELFNSYKIYKTLRIITLLISITFFILFCVFITNNSINYIFLILGIVTAIISRNFKNKRDYFISKLEEVSTIAMALQDNKNEE